MNFHIGNAPTGRLFSLHSSAHNDAPNQREGAASQYPGQDPGAGFDPQEPSFFKKHSLLAAYIAFTVILCAALAAVATVAINGLPAIVFGF
jgi:hypothetical protein